MDALNSATVNNITTAQQAPADIPVRVQGNPIPVQPVQSVNTENQNRQPTPDEIKTAISSANRRAHFGHTNAQFSYHEATKRISVKIVDEDTNEVIREIPPEETLEMISKMWELAGIMVDEKR